MFGSLKKLSARKSGQQIAEATLDLINSLLPFEYELLKFEDDPSGNNQAISRTVDASVQNPATRKAVQSLLWELNGPIPINLIRDDIFKPFLTAKAPPELTGVILKKAFKDIVQEQHASRKPSGMEEIWGEVKADVLGDNADYYSEASKSDLRFSDL